MIVIFALAAALCYGSADFLGGAASRRVSSIAVLCVSAPVGEILVVALALVVGGPVRLSGLAWGLAGGVAGGGGLIAFYAGLAAGPMSVVAPVSALVSTVLPVGVAMAKGERLSPAVLAGAFVCLVAIVLVSLQGSRPTGPDATGSAAPAPDATSPAIPAADAASLAANVPDGTGPNEPAPAIARPARRNVAARGLGCAVLAGVAFGLFYLFLGNAGTSGVLWPVAMARLAGTAVALTAAVITRTRPPGGRASRRTFVMALASGALDATANLCYVFATRAGLLGLAVLITSLYPGVTVLAARLALRERMRPVQRAGLLLAAVGVVLLTV